MIEEDGTCSAAAEQPSGKGKSLRDVAHVGGWKGTQVLQEVHQLADEETMEAVVLGARPLRAAR